MLRSVAAGLAAGVVWGVVARGFMRLLTTDPAFSWSGTLFILGLSAVAGLAWGLVRGARRTGRSPWWRLAALPMLLLFFGPGIVLLPGALGVAAVLRGGPVLRVLGALLASLTPIAVVMEASGTPTGRELAGLAVMLGCVVALGWAAGEVLRAWPGRERAAVQASAPLVAAPA